MFSNSYVLLVFEKFFFYFVVSYNYLLIVYYLIICFLVISIMFLFFKKKNYLLSNFFFSFFFNEVEKELNSLDDLKYILSIFFFFFFYNFYFYFAYNLISGHLIFISIFLIKSILILVPLTLVLEYGFYGIIFIRGTTSSTISSYEFILDYVNLTAYFLRIFIQTIRIIVILTTFFTFSELFIEYYYLFYEQGDSLLATGGISTKTSFIIFLSHVSFEIFHLVFIFLLQTVSFHVTVF